MQALGHVALIIGYIVLGWLTLAILTALVALLMHRRKGTSPLLTMQEKAAWLCTCMGLGLVFPLTWWVWWHTRGK